MLICAACRQTLDDDSRFCGYCGFRVSPIPVEEHRLLSESIPPLSAQVDPPSLPRAAIRPQQIAGLPSDVLEEVSTEDIATSATLPPTAPATAPDASTERTGQRRFPRFPIRVEVGYGSEHNFYAGFLENLSGGGLFVATHQPASIGALLEVTFTVPGLEHPCTTLCLVRWVRDFNPLLPEMVPGMGLQFSQLEAEARAAIQLFIQHREPIFYDD
jgi:uncharacterized protein (TIGR02266 family)